MSLPECMMPDGGNCCEGYQEVRQALLNLLECYVDYRDTHQAGIWLKDQAPFQQAYDAAWKVIRS